jgi:tetratricopeptide (TPR) repeat protein
MSGRGRPFGRVVALFVVALAMLRSPRCMGQDAETRREAAKHFQRGVTLYSEADYRGALVEFRRAAALIPNGAVLYNIGETEYQLQDYAGALTTFERYLNVASPGESHRAEVESNVQTLRSRVGHIVISTTPAGADIVIDDQPIGKTPFDKPVRVSLGRRKVVASMLGRSQVTRYVEVAAEDVVSVALSLPPLATAAAPATEPPISSARTAGTAENHPGRGSSLRTVGWVATGALVAGAATFGFLALREARDLKTARETFPTTASTLDHDAKLTTTYAVLADALTAGALVVGGLTLYSTFSSSSHPQATGSIQMTVGLGSARLEAAF